MFNGARELLKATVTGFFLSPTSSWHDERNSRLLGIPRQPRQGLGYIQGLWNVVDDP